MSLDVDLYVTIDGSSIRVFEANITHNLTKMAANAGVYYACWHPEEINATRAKHILPMLDDGIKALREFPDHYKQFAPENGWGTYEGFLAWLEKYAEACRKFPSARIEAST